MFQLNIYFSDGTLRWTEYFNKKEDLDKWLKEEMTRKYWEKGFTYEILDHTPPPPSADDLKKEVERKDRTDKLKSRLNDLADKDAKEPLNDDEVKECMRCFLQLQYGNRRE